MKILVIEDHPKLRENIITYLSMQGHTVEWCIHGEAWLNMLENNYDVLILDMNMPVMDGKTFIEEVRKRNIHTPILVLTSNSLLDDKLSMFSLGADDFMTKPFDLRELEARILAIGRRKEKTLEDSIQIGEYTLELGKKSLKIWEITIEISNKEYGILEFLGRNKWYPKSKTDILEAVWWIREVWLDYDSITVEAHISMIRKKLGKDIIQTLKWVWYLISR
jgi:DNA-binding response OmpR family regulator